VLEPVPTETKLSLLLLPLLLPLLNVSRLTPSPPVVTRICWRRSRFERPAGVAAAVVVLLLLWL
jgi:hypothetical protein